MEEPNAPEISFNDELVIWISSTAMKAPSITPDSANQFRQLTFFSGGGFVLAVMAENFPDDSRVAGCPFEDAIAGRCEFAGFGAGPDLWERFLDQPSVRPIDLTRGGFHSPRALAIKDDLNRYPLHDFREITGRVIRGKQREG